MSKQWRSTLLKSEYLLFRKVGWETELWEIKFNSTKSTENSDL